MATTTAQKLEAVGATLTSGLVGFLVGGPLGLGIGLAVGGGIDFLVLRAKAAAPALNTVGVASPLVGAAMTPGATGLPATADVASGTKAFQLLSLGAAKGHTAEAAPAKAWLIKFQSSVGLPATGALDSATRAMLVLAVPAAANLPATTLLG